MNPAVEGRNHHDRARHERRTNETKRKKEAERRKAQFSCRACKARRASSGTRSPFGVPQRLLSKGLTHPLAQRRTRLRGAGAVDVGVLPQRRLRFQRAPRMPVIVPAGMMSKPPECRGDEPPARGHRNSLRQTESPAGVLHVSEMALLYQSRNRCQASSPHRRQRFESAALFVSRFFARVARPLRVRANQRILSDPAQAVRRCGTAISGPIPCGRFRRRSPADRRDLAIRSA